jgi:hypothetical protein
LAGHLPAASSLKLLRTPEGSRGLIPREPPTSGVPRNAPTRPRRWRFKLASICRLSAEVIEMQILFGRSIWRPVAPGSRPYLHFQNRHKYSGYPLGIVHINTGPSLALPHRGLKPCGQLGGEGGRGGASATSAGCRGTGGVDGGVGPAGGLPAPSCTLAVATGAPGAGATIGVQADRVTIKIMNENALIARTCFVPVSLAYWQKHSARCTTRQIRWNRRRHPR